MFSITLFIVTLTCGLGLISADCNVVSKKDWGGLEPVRVNYLPRPVDLVFIQHTVTFSCTTDVQCAELLTNIQTYHMDELNFYDIGSSFYVGGNGKIYEGSGWLHVGAHTNGYNNVSIGISFIGNNKVQFQLNAVKALLKCGVKSGHLTSNYHVVGHKQLIGRKLYNKIRSWPEWLKDASSIQH